MLEIQVIGNLAQDAKVFTSGDKRYLSFTVGVSQAEKTKEGQKIERTTWLRCTMSHTKVFEEYLKKGKQVYVRGELNVKIWNKEDKSGIELSTWVDYIRLL